MLKLFFLDTETRCRLDINVGTDRYTRAAECRIVTYAFVTGPAKIWLPYCQPIPQDLKDALDDPEFLILAHNAAFDRLILARALKIVTGVARWRCTMAGASAHGLPGSLESLGKVCGLSEDEAKLVDDKKLIDTFCVPQPATGKFIEPEDAPAEWDRFCRYAIRDTEALRTIWARLPKSNYDGVNLRSWMLDQLINERGFGFDAGFAKAASDFLDAAREASRKVMLKNTEGEVASAMQAKKLLAYVRNRYGLDIETMRAGDVRDYLESDDLDPTLRTLLEERLEASKNSGAKYKRGLGLVGPENRIRHWSRWSGAGRTGRHAARGFQVHNLARPAISVRQAGRIRFAPVKANYIDDTVIPFIREFSLRKNHGDLVGDSGFRGAIRGQLFGMGAGAGEDAGVHSLHWQADAAAGAGTFALDATGQPRVRDSSPLQEQRPARQDGAPAGGSDVSRSDGSRSEPHQPQQDGQLRLQLGVGDALRESAQATEVGPFDLAAIALRHVVVAAPGNELVVADFKNIETVVTAWVAGEESVLHAFRDLFDNPKDKSKDPYRMLAGKMLGKAPQDVTESERQMGKVAILAFGFGGGVPALVNMAIAYQMDLEPLAGIVLPAATPEQLEKANTAWERAFLKGEDFELSRDVYMACDVLKQSFRTANPAINKMRYDLNTAILEAVADKNGTVYNVARCQVWCQGSFLTIQLPSGRRLLYASPILKQEEIEDPLSGRSWTARYITYLTVRGRSWRRERAWAGLFVENIVQAIANDVLRAAMLRVHDDTLTVPAIVEYLATLEPYARTAISLHVHDEIGLDCPKGSYSAERFMSVIKTKEPWMAGLPIAADIWSNPRYGKRG
jgi:hypothetical protein